MVLSVLLIITSCSSPLIGKQRVIVFIQEGLGHEILTAAQIYSENTELWDWRFDNQWYFSSTATLPITLETSPDGSDPRNPPIHNSDYSWDGSMTMEPNTSGFRQELISGYKWLIENATDSNQAMTALSSGLASFNTSINWLSMPEGDGAAIPPEKLLLRWMSEKGLKTGIISDLPFTNSSAHILAGVNNDETNKEIKDFNKLLEFNHLNLFVATGHPKYNELGQALTTPVYELCSQGYWKDFRSRGRENGWDVIFGDDNLMGVNSQNDAFQQKRLVIMQFGNTASTKTLSTDVSGLRNNLLNSMRFQLKMALAFLNEGDEGFLLVVHLGRLPFLLKDELKTESIQEVINTFDCLQTCENWIEENEGWENTTLLLTSPYEYGLIWGPDSASFPFSPISDRGKSRLPGYRMNHMGPTASLTPMLIKGKLADYFSNLQKDQDPVYGDYVHLTKLNRLLRQIQKTPESSIEQP